MTKTTWVQLWRAVQGKTDGCRLQNRLQEMFRLLQVSLLVLSLAVSIEESVADGVALPLKTDFERDPDLYIANRTVANQNNWQCHIGSSADSTVIVDPTG